MEKFGAYVKYMQNTWTNYCCTTAILYYRLGISVSIFNDVPTYDDIVRGTPDCSKITGVNKNFKVKESLSGLMAGGESFS